MKCLNCGEKVFIKENIECSNCHVKFPVECSNCHSFNPKYSICCNYCGEKLDQHKSSLKNFETLRELRKNVAVVFADISGFTALSESMDPEEVRDLINGCFDYITKPVYELEGTIDKYIGDCVMILFGAKYSHADDVKRAVSCAVKMQERIKEYSKEIVQNNTELKLSIGIDYGLVVTGKVGNAFDSDSTVMGDVVNTAQRLQTAADAGKILVSKRCYDETSDVVEYNELIEINAKNKKDPVKCSYVINILDRHVDEIKALIDREFEFNLLNDIYREDKVNRYVHIIGPSGIGKTHLIDHFSRTINHENIRVNCTKFHKSKSYNTVSKLLVDIIRINDEGIASSKTNKLMTSLNYLIADYSKTDFNKMYNFLTYVIGLEISEAFSNVLNAMKYEDIVKESRIQVINFFNALHKKRDAIIVIDNMQWADEESVKIIYELAKKCDAKDTLYILASHDKMAMDENICKLEPLNKEGINKLIISELPCDTVDNNLLETIVKISTGNPQYIKEYIHSLMRQGEYSVDEGILTVEQFFLDVIPSSLENLILNNLSEFSNTELQFLFLASCIGKSFNSNWVSKIISGFDYAETVRKLEKINVIELEDVYTTSSGINKKYTFKQEIVRQVIYDSILNKQKVNYNLKIAELIELDYSQNLDVYYDVLVEYYKKAEYKEKQLSFIYLSAKKEHREFRLNQAIDLFESYIELNNVPNEEKIIECYTKIGSLYNALGDVDKALETLYKGLKLSTLRDQQHAIQLMIIEIFKDTGRFDEALDIINDIEKYTRENSNIYGKLLFNKCNILYFKRDKNLIELGESSEKILLSTRDYDSLGKLYSILGMFQFMNGKSDDGIYYLMKAFNYSKKSGNLKLLNKVSGNLGIIYHQSGQVSKALDYFKKTLDTSNEISDLKTNITVSINLGVLYLEKGQFDRGQELLEKALEKAEETSLIYQQCTALTNLGDIHYERGHYDKAVDSYDLSLDIALKHEMSAEEGILLSNLAKVNILKDKFEDAENQLEKSRIVLEDLEELSGLVDVFYNKALLEMKKENYRKSLEYCDMAIDYAEKSEDDSKLAQILRLRGDAYSNTGQNDEALLSYDRSIILSHQLESEYQSAKSHYSRSKLYKNMDNLSEYGNDILLVRSFLKDIDVCIWKTKNIKDIMG